MILIVYIHIFLAGKWLLDSGKVKGWAEGVRCFHRRENLQKGILQRRSTTYQASRIFTISWELSLAKFQRIIFNTRILYVNCVFGEWKVQGEDRSVESIRRWVGKFSILVQSNPSEDSGADQHSKSQSSIHTWANRSPDFPEPLLQQHGNGNLPRAGEEVGLIVNVVVSAAEKARGRVRKSSRMEEILEKADEERQTRIERKTGMGATLSSEFDQEISGYPRFDLKNWKTQRGHCQVLWKIFGVFDWFGVAAANTKILQHGLRWFTCCGSLCYFKSRQSTRRETFYTGELIFSFLYMISTSIFLLKSLKFFVTHTLS